MQRLFDDRKLTIDVQRLFDIKKTQLQMVQDRGYNITPDEELILTTNYQGFQQYLRTLTNTNPGRMTRSLLSRSYIKILPNGTEQRMLVFFGGKTDTQKKQVSTEVVREFIGTIQKYQFHEAILIVDAALSSMAEKILEGLKLTKWQVFFDPNLTFNVARHVDVHQHELLSLEETSEVLKQLRVDLSKLPIIYSKDPVIRYYGWESGRVVRVHRNDQAVSVLSPNSINYRVIVASPTNK